jgi:ferredoxin
MKLSKDKFADFVVAISEQTVYAPQKIGETTRFAPVAKGSKVNFTAANTTIPPKSVVFPQTETLLRFELGKTDLAVPVQEGKAVMLGVRPCDARAMAIVDNVFNWDVEDPYYLQKRTDLTLVGLACLECGINCFCTSVGGGPASKEGLDVLMTDLGEDYLLEVLTERGAALCQSAAGLFAEAVKEDQAAAEKLHAEAVNKIIRQNPDTGLIPAGLPRLWEHPLWSEVSESCLGCGICTYLCPTCHCFDIQDESEGCDSRRCRTWDSCMFSEYTLHASGHNPRPTRRERTRNRINHKYSYFVDKFNVIACVGCGRCINLCPVNIDILNVLAKVGEAL